MAFPTEADATSVQTPALPSPHWKPLSMCLSPFCKLETATVLPPRCSEHRVQRSVAISLTVTGIFIRHVHRFSWTVVCRTRLMLRDRVGPGIPMHTPSSAGPVLLTPPHPGHPRTFTNGQRGCREAILKVLRPSPVALHLPPTHHCTVLIPVSTSGGLPWASTERLGKCFFFFF